MKFYNEEEKKEMLQGDIEEMFWEVDFAKQQMLENKQTEAEAMETIEKVDNLCKQITIVS